jgi:uncharacterized protein YqeY
LETLERINDELKTALKSGDSEKASVLRLLKSALKNAEIAKGSELTEVEELSVLDKQAKQRRDSITQYMAGNRKDLADKENLELEIIEEYLPQKLSEEETSKLIDEVISETRADSISQMGQVIKEVMARAKGQAEGGVVSRIAKEKLS